MSDFLENLKNAVDRGEFNSKAAEKINQINELAEKKVYGEELKNSVNQKLEADKKKTTPLSIEEVEKASAELNKKMQKNRQIDFVNSLIAEVMNIEYEMGMVLDEIDSQKNKFNILISQVQSIENKYEKQIESDDMYRVLGDKLNEVREYYKEFFTNNLK